MAQVYETSTQEQQASTVDRKFGMFAGVFTPTLLTILGAIMYLREGWVVGNAGLGGALLIILLANTITITTALSISSVATNIRVGSGGAFSIISQSLGLEVGGSVSVPLYLAQSISVAFYIFAFAEGWQRIFPEHPFYLIVPVGFVIAFVIARISANLALRVQYLILALVAISLISILLGAFPIADHPGFTVEPVFWGDFPSGGFWAVFAVFFPAVTGVLAGVNMSGALKDPRTSIPRGTLAAVLLSLLIYLILAYWLARVAPPEELVANVTVMVDQAFWPPAVLVGILAATFSSALTSLVGAPRVLQAMAQHGILPFGEQLAQETDAGEPRPALYATGLIAVVALIFGLVGGGINAIAPLITMFFLIMYAMLNGVVLLEQTLGLVSFRPQLRVPRVVPFIGFVGCLIAMFLINPVFSLVALVVTVSIYAYLSRRQLLAPWSDVRSGLFVTLAEWAAKRVARMPVSQERAWKPSLLAPVHSTDELLGSYRFIKALTYPRGSVRVVGIYPSGEVERVEGLRHLTQAFANDGVFSQITFLQHENFAEGLSMSLAVLHSVFFRPNALFLPLNNQLEEDTLQQVIKRTRENEVGVVFYRQHPVTALGREQTINVWIREQSPDWEVGLRLSNLDLALLLAYQLALNWHGQINLITIVENAKDLLQGKQFLQQLINYGRMPVNTKAIVKVGDLAGFLPQAPAADLNIFGLPPRLNLDFTSRMVAATGSSCMFVLDSGHESALA